jgi:hypothetical protein
MDNSICHTRSEVVSKIEKHHFSRSPHPPYSPDTRLCNFWLFNILKGILKDREFHLNDEVEKGIASAWNDLTFNDVQSVFHNWMNPLARVMRNSAEYTSKSMINHFLTLSE